MGVTIIRAFLDGAFDVRGRGFLEPLKPIGLRYFFAPNKESVVFPLVFTFYVVVTRVLLGFNTLLIAGGGVVDRRRSCSTVGGSTLGLVRIRFSYLRIMIAIVVWIQIAWAGVSSTTLTGGVRFGWDLRTGE